MRFSLLAAALPAALLLTPTDAHAFCGGGMAGFGAVPGATFGGSGISNTSVVFINSYCSGTTLGLTATPRFGSPALTNNGSNTFFAQAGTGASAPINYAKWNFDFYVGGGNPSDYTLLMDVDPSAAQNFIAYDFTGANENSWNVGMSFYGPGYAGPGDATVDGQYSYELIEWSNASHTRQSAEVDMEVIVGNGPVTTAPEPASIVLMASGLGALGLITRRRRKSA